MRKKQDHNSKKLKESLNNNKSKEFKRLLDILFIIVLLCMCIVGLALEYDHTSQHDIRKNAGAVVSASRGVDKNENGKEVVPIVSYKFDIVGAKEVFNTLKFTLEPFDKHHVYTVYWGDGEKKTLTSPRVSHQYTNIEKFQIKIYKGSEDDRKRELIYDELLNIGRQPSYRGNSQDSMN